jgi:hypothetical protein
MKFPLNALQTAVYKDLHAAFPKWRIFDEAPQQPVYPYVVVGEVSAVDWRTKSEPGAILFLTLHFWSQYEGKREAAQMMNDALVVLTGDRSPDLGPDFHVVDRNFEAGDIIIDLDGYTKHGLLRLRYLIEERV